MVVILGKRNFGNSFIDVSCFGVLPVQRRNGKMPTSHCRDPVSNPGGEIIKQCSQTASLTFHQCVEEKGLKGFAESTTLI